MRLNDLLSKADWWNSLDQSERNSIIENPRGSILNGTSTSQNEAYRNYVEQYLLSGLGDNSISAIDAQNALASSGISASTTFTEYLNNMLSRQATSEANDYNTQMRDTSLTSAADQLSSLGLSGSNVISTGGAGIGSSSVASVDKSNGALQERLNQFNNSAQMSRTLLSLVGGLASAGIFGGSRLLAQRAAAKMAASTAHAASIIKYNFDRFGNSMGYSVTDSQYK